MGENFSLDKDGQVPPFLQVAGMLSPYAAQYVNMQKQNYVSGQQKQIFDAEMKVQDLKFREMQEKSRLIQEYQQREAEKQRKYQNYFDVGPPTEEGTRPIDPAIPVQPSDQDTIAGTILKMRQGKSMGKTSLEMRQQEYMKPRNRLTKERDPVSGGTIMVDQFGNQTIGPKAPAAKTPKQAKLNKLEIAAATPGPDGRPAFNLQEIATKALNGDKQAQRLLSWFGEEQSKKANTTLQALGSILGMNISPLSKGTHKGVDPNNVAELDISGSR